MSNGSLLATSLLLAVPLWQHQLKSVPMEELLTRVGPAAQLIAEHGDVLLYGSPQKGEAANIFNKTAEALAILSFLPGGVKLFGQHWVATHDSNLTEDTAT